MRQHNQFEKVDRAPFHRHSRMFLAGIQYCAKFVLCSNTRFRCAGPPPSRERRCLGFVSQIDYAVALSAMEVTLAAQRMIQKYNCGYLSSDYRYHIKIYLVIVIVSADSTPIPHFQLEYAAI